MRKRVIYKKKPSFLKLALEIEFMFKNKNAIVTGGRRGIGRAIAVALAQRGANVAVIASKPDGTPILNELKGFGNFYGYLATDLSIPSQREKLIDRAEDMLSGKVDILVNCAGTVTDGALTDLTPEKYIFSRELLMDAPIDLMQQALPGMCSRRYGKIVNISSVYGIRNAANCFSYSVFKRAVIAATECVAKSVAQYNVNVNCIAPGTIHTDLTVARNDFSPEHYQELLKKYPAGRTGKTEDIVAAFLYLASDASEFVHGHTLVVDGGFLL